MSFFGIGPSAKLLTVDVTYTNPTRTCVVKSSNHSESNSMNNIARETLPLITSGARSLSITLSIEENVCLFIYADECSLFALHVVCIHIKQTGDSIEGVLHVSPGKKEGKMSLSRTMYIDFVGFDSSLSLSLSLFLSLFAKMTTTYTFIRNLLFLFISPLSSRAII